jgi:hypothetical protein
MRTISVKSIHKIAGYRTPRRNFTEFRDHGIILSRDHHTYTHNPGYHFSYRDMSAREHSTVANLTEWTGRLIGLSDPWTRELYRHQRKCRHLQNFTCKGTLRQVLICLIPLLPHCIRRTFCTHTWKVGEGGERTREKVRGAKVHKAGSKIPLYTPG